MVLFYFIFIFFAKKLFSLNICKYYYKGKETYSVKNKVSSQDCLSQFNNEKVSWHQKQRRQKNCNNNK